MDDEPFEIKAEVPNEELARAEWEEGEKEITITVSDPDVTVTVEYSDSIEE